MGNFFYDNQFPPPTLPKTLLKLKEAYAYWICILPNIAKPARYSLCARIDERFLNTIEATFESIYELPEQKVKKLGTAIAELDTLRFLFQLGWEGKILKTAHYAKLSQQLEEVGRMLGGWRRGLLQKSPTLSGR